VGGGLPGERPWAAARRGSGASPQSASQPKITEANCSRTFNIKGVVPRTARGNL